jgi:hypothetical protein
MSPRLRLGKARIAAGSRGAALVLAGVVAFGLAGCGASRPVGNDEYSSSASQDTGAGASTGLLGADPTISIGVTRHDANDQGGAILGVNAYAWRGALDTLSFMPIASADPFGGVITTEWYQIPAVPTERFKAVAYIMRRSLRSDSVRLAVFRQVNKDGVWVDAAVAPMTITALENKILERALDLREQTSASLSASK